MLPDPDQQDITRPADRPLPSGEDPACGVTPAAGPLIKNAKSVRCLRGRAQAICEGPVVFLSKFMITDRTVIGAYSYFRSASFRCPVTVGRCCSFGPHLLIGEPNHPVDWLSTSSFQYSEGRFATSGTLKGFRHRPMTKAERPGIRGGEVTIGNDVWIGSRVQILRGVTIGDGAIIAADALVTKDVPPYAIVGGVPARVIRRRFDDALVERLIALRWWQYDLMGLSGIDFADAEGAVTEIERRRDAGLLSPMRFGTQAIGRRVRGGAEEEGEEEEDGAED